MTILQSTLDQRERSLWLLASAFVALQAIATAWGLLHGWPWMLAPVVLVAGVVCFLNPTIGLFLLVIAVFFKHGSILSGRVVVADLLTVPIIAGTVVRRALRGWFLSEANPLFKPIAVSLAVLGLSLLVTIDLTSGVINWMRHLQIFLLTLVVASHMTPWLIDRITKIFLAGVTVVSVRNILVFVSYGGAERVLGPTGPFFPLFLSLGIGHSAVCSIMADKGRERIGWGILMLVFVMGQIASQSRAAWLQAVLSLLVMTIILWRWSRPGERRVVRKRLFSIVIGSVIAMLAILAIWPSLFAHPFHRLMSAVQNQSATMDIRYFMWKTGVREFLKSPLIGIGLGQFGHWDQIMSGWRFDPMAQFSKGLGAHNDFISYLAETGLIGLTAILWYFARVIKIGHEALRLSPTIRDARNVLTLLVPVWGIVLSFFFGTHLFYSLAGIIIAVYIGMLASRWQSLTRM